MLLDLEISLVRAHNWSLKEIDETDVTSLLMFVARYAETEGGTALDVNSKPSPPTPLPKRRVGKRGKRAFIDQVNWL